MFGVLKKTVTYRIPCAEKVTLVKSCISSNKVLLDLGDVHSKLGMHDRGGQARETVGSRGKMVQSLMSTI